MSNSQEIQEIHSSVKRVVCVWDRVLRSTRSPSPQWLLTIAFMNPRQAKVAANAIIIGHILDPMLVTLAPGTVASICAKLKTVIYGNGRGFDEAPIKDTIKDRHGSGDHICMWYINNVMHLGDVGLYCIWTFAIFCENYTCWNGEKCILLILLIHKIHDPVLNCYIFFIFEVNFCLYLHVSVNNYFFFDFFCILSNSTIHSCTQFIFIKVNIVIILLAEIVITFYIAFTST